MAAPADLPRRFTEAEAAEILRISAVTLRRRRRAGEIAHIKDGRKVFYTADHLAAYSCSKEVPAKVDAGENPSRGEGAASPAASGEPIHGMTPELARRAEEFLLAQLRQKPSVKHK